MNRMAKFVLGLVMTGACLADAHAATQEEKVLEELNLARTKPAEYAKYVENHKRRFIDDRVYSMPGRGRIATQEGKAAVDEAIEFLKKAQPVGKLSMSKGLSEAAMDHCKDLGKSGKTGHTGSDGSKMTDRMNRHGKWQRACGENIAFGPSDARQIVIQLIVDDGVANRGHRVNIFKKDFKVVGIAVAPHAKYGNMCTMDFAGGYVDKR